MIKFAAVHHRNERRLQLTHRRVLPVNYLFELAVVALMGLLYHLDLAWTHPVYHFIAYLLK